MTLFEICNTYKSDVLPDPESEVRADTLKRLTTLSNEPDLNIDPSKIRVKLPLNGPVDEEISFTIDLTKCASGSVRIKILAPDGRYVPVEVQHSNILPMKATFMPYTNGKYKVQIFYDTLSQSKEVPGSPFFVKIGNANDYESVDGLKEHLLPNQNNVSILSDENNDGADFLISDTSCGGTHTYRITEATEEQMFVLPKSPTEYVSIIKNEFDPSKISLDGPFPAKIESGKECYFYINLNGTKSGELCIAVYQRVQPPLKKPRKKAKFNCCSAQENNDDYAVLLSGPMYVNCNKGESSTWRVVESKIYQDADVLKCAFTPTVKGLYCVDIVFNNVRLSGVPMKVHVEE